MLVWSILFNIYLICRNLELIFQFPIIKSSLQHSILSFRKEQKNQEYIIFKISLIIDNNIQELYIEKFTQFQSFNQGINLISSKIKNESLKFVQFNIN